jgi:hypothetical protein
MPVNSGAGPRSLRSDPFDAGWPVGWLCPSTWFSAAWTGFDRSRDCSVSVQLGSALVRSAERAVSAPTAINPAVAITTTPNTLGGPFGSRPHPKPRHHCPTALGDGEQRQPGSKRVGEDEHERRPGARRGYRKARDRAEDGTGARRPDQAEPNPGEQAAGDAAALGRRRSANRRSPAPVAITREPGVDGVINRAPARCSRPVARSNTSETAGTRSVSPKIAMMAMAMSRSAELGSPSAEMIWTLASVKNVKLAISPAMTR